MPLNLRIPAEEELHDGCIMQWPENRQVYREGDFLDLLQQTIIKVANVISEFEPVMLAAHNEKHEQISRSLSSSVELVPIQTDDLWARDSGPTFAFRSNQPVVTHFNFNAWGNKQPHENDRQVARAFADYLGIEYFPASVVGEAGGIEWDGSATLMAHESSWVNDNRNPSLSKAQITENLLALYGAEELIWAPGLSGEDITDYHIDSLARFVAPREALIQLPYADGSNDPWITAAYGTFDVLRSKGIKLHEVDEPTRTRIHSQDFVASYVNYYLANGAVIGAEFGDQQSDQMAYEQLKKLYPEREVILLNVDPIGEVGGGIHCATQQIPEGVL